MGIIRRWRQVLIIFIFLVGFGILLGLYDRMQYSGRHVLISPKQNRDAVSRHLPEANHPSVSNSSTEAIIQQRQSHIRYICERQKVPVFRSIVKGQFLIYPPLRFSMCYVPKAGCTFWKRVFIGLQRNLTNIHEITKIEAHYSHIDTLAAKRTFIEAFGFLSQSKRVLFVRDPYTRLYSAYEDKLFLGDFFLPFGRYIVKSIRKAPANDSLQCGHDVTFDEFLRYVLVISNKPFGGGGDEHWIPINSLCRPCDFKFDIIGKLETFERDSEYIFQAIGINISSEPGMSADFMANDSMKQTIDMVWDKRPHCLTVTQSLKRMWISYQSQGHIHRSLEFPKEEISEKITKDEFLNLAMEAYWMKPMSPHERKEQRKIALKSAYSSVSRKTIQEIQRTFSLDFALFQYPIKREDFI